MRDRLMAALAGTFGLLAGALAVLGLYGVIAYMVARRRNEIGVRIALGASRSRVIGLVLREAVLLLAIGLTLGTATGGMGGTSGSFDGVWPDAAGSGDLGRRGCPVGDGGTVRQLRTRLASGPATADGRSAGRIENSDTASPAACSCALPTPPLPSLLAAHPIRPSAVAANGRRDARCGHQPRRLGSYHPARLRHGPGGHRCVVVGVPVT